jgi:Fe-S-cluster containining protein
VNQTRGQAQQQAFEGLADYARTVIASALGREATPQRAVQVFRKAALVTDSNIRERLKALDRMSLEDRSKNALECSAGCAYCCYQWVRCTVPEVLAVAAFIREHWTEAQIAELLADSVEYRARFKAMPEGKIFALGCPLLRNNMCSVYEVRPFICRGCNSMDAEKCREGVEDPNNTLIPVAMPLVHTAGAIRRGMTQGIGDAGFNANELVFALALQTALSVADAGDRFFAGEDVFAGDYAD